MKQKPSSRRKRSRAKSVLRLPDLEHAKAAVLNSLNSADAKRGYRHAIDEFVDWYCSEPRLAFNRIVVFRYRCYLESRQLAPGTINLPLGAVRRLDDPVRLKQSVQKGDEVLLDCEWPALPIEPELVVAESTPQSGHELAPENAAPAGWLSVCDYPGVSTAK